MSSTTWTAAAPRSEATPWSGTAWRLVEAQHLVSTAKLTDTFEEQEILEDILEETKPPLPPECRHLHDLLSTPFRYATYPTGSRFRAAGRTPGVFYAAEHVETAVAEMAFYRMRFYQESPGLEAPGNAAVFTAFRVAVSAAAVIDLTAPPFDAEADLWQHPTDYTACQALAEIAREAGVGVILSGSVRDPERRRNVNVLDCAAFAASTPTGHQTWQIKATANRAFAIHDFPRKTLSFERG